MRIRLRNIVDSVAAFALSIAVLIANPSGDDFYERRSQVLHEINTETYSDEVRSEALDTNVLPRETKAFQREEHNQSARERLDRIEQRLTILEKKVNQQ